MYQNLLAHLEEQEPLLFGPGADPFLARDSINLLVGQMKPLGKTVF